ncbi:MAG: hypothetical protein EBT39_00425 [Sphingobacteriia bacterium]|nr:hypothetical protein [Candidatus Fonsibacter lacus]
MLFYDLPLIDHIMNKTKSSTTYINNETVYDFLFIGLLIGLKFNPILIISSIGLALLMLSGLIIRIKLKDSIWISFPALFYMCLNAYIFLAAIKFTGF